MVLSLKLTVKQMNWKKKKEPVSLVCRLTGVVG
jgi:hypothetical protein